MAHIDPVVASTIDRANASGREQDEDELLEQLEKEDDHLTHLREQRLQQLHTEFSRAKHLRANEGHGSYTEIKDEKALMDITTSTKLCIVHFWKPDFNRCRILDNHFEVGQCVPKIIPLSSLSSDAKYLQRPSHNYTLTPDSSGST